METLNAQLTKCREADPEEELGKEGPYTVMLRIRNAALGTATPGTYVGMAHAQNLTELFWMIDTHCNPYDCEIRPLESGSYMHFVSDDEEESEYESTVTYLKDDEEPNEAWFQPIWDSKKYLGVRLG